MVMHANPGDWLLVEGRAVGNRPRRGRILEVRSADGTPPYLVRWLDGREALVFPGPDARVVDAGELARIEQAEIAQIAAVQSEITAHTAR
jgi:hypothetical protein